MTLFLTGFCFGVTTTAFVLASTICEFDLIRTTVLRSIVSFLLGVSLSALLYEADGHTGNSLMLSLVALPQKRKLIIGCILGAADVCICALLVWIAHAAWTACCSMNYIGAALATIAILAVALVVTGTVVVGSKVIESKGRKRGVKPT